MNLNVLELPHEDEILKKVGTKTNHTSMKDELMKINTFNSREFALKKEISEIKIAMQIYRISVIFFKHKKCSLLSSFLIATLI